MSTSENVSIAGYVSRPYEPVCQLLETWKGHSLSGDVTTRPGYFLGDLVRVSRSVARLPVGRRGTVPIEQVAELRVLPVDTGRDALTEVLLVTSDNAVASIPRSIRVQGARSLLDALLRELDAAPTSPELKRHELSDPVEREAPRLAS